MPAQARRARAVGVPASRELRLRRRRLLARRRTRLFWGGVFACSCAGALRSRCARAALALRSHCARAAMHTRRPPGSQSRGQSTTTAAAPPHHPSPLVVTVPSSFMLTLARALSLSHALSPSRVMMLSLRSRCAHTRARVSSLRNATLASPHPRSLAPRSRLLPRAVCACFLCPVVVTYRHVRHCLLRRLCLLFVGCRHLPLPSCASLLAASSSSIPGDQPFRALVCLGHHRRLIARRACPSNRRPTLPGFGLPWSSPPSLTGMPLYQAANPSGLWSALVITAVSDGRAPLPRGRRFP